MDLFHDVMAIFISNSFKGCSGGKISTGMYLPPRHPILAICLGITEKVH